jgi:hypothetical protein
LHIFAICRILSKNVKFCAYSIPHPNDRKVLLQIQVYPGRGSAVQALEKGLSDLHEFSHHVKSVFQVSCRKKRICALVSLLFHLFHQKNMTSILVVVLVLLMQIMFFSFTSCFPSPYAPCQAECSRFKGK